MSASWPSEPVPPPAASEVVALLRQRLSLYGFQRADVVPGRDHDGDPVIFVDVHYGRTGAPLNAAATYGLTNEIRRVLAMFGEARFPIVRHLFEDDARVVRR